MSPNGPHIPKAITPAKTPSQIFTNKRIECFKTPNKIEGYKWFEFFSGVFGWQDLDFSD